MQAEPRVQYKEREGGREGGEPGLPRHADTPSLTDSDGQNLKPERRPCAPSLFSQVAYLLKFANIFLPKASQEQGSFQSNFSSSQMGRREQTWRKINQGPFWSGFSGMCLPCECLRSTGRGTKVPTAVLVYTVGPTMGSLAEGRERRWTWAERDTSFRIILPVMMAQM